MNVAIPQRRGSELPMNATRLSSVMGAPPSSGAANPLSSMMNGWCREETRGAGWSRSPWRRCDAAPERRLGAGIGQQAREAAGTSQDGGKGPFQENSLPGDRSIDPTRAQRHQGQGSRFRARHEAPSSIPAPGRPVRARNAGWRRAASGHRSGAWARTGGRGGRSREPSAAATALSTCSSRCRP